MTSTNIIIATMTLALVYFVPGFIWSYVFFPGGKSLSAGQAFLSIDIGIAERLVLSVALSFALVPLLLFIYNQISGIPVSGLLTWVTAFVVSGLGLVMIYMFSRSVYSRLFSLIRRIHSRLFTRS